MFPATCRKGQQDSTCTCLAANVIVISTCLHWSSFRGSRCTPAEILELMESYCRFKFMSRIGLGLLGSKIISPNPKPSIPKFLENLNPKDGVMQVVFPFLNGFKADESWIYRCPDDLSKMFLRPGTEKTFQGHECFIPGEPGASTLQTGPLRVAPRAGNEAVHCPERRASRKAHTHMFRFLFRRQLLLQRLLLQDAFSLAPLQRVERG